MCLHSHIWLLWPTVSSPWGSSAPGIFLARILKWVAILISKESSRLRDRTHVFCISCTEGRFLTTEPLVWVSISITEAGKPLQSPKDLDFAAMTIRAGVGETDLNREIWKLRIECNCVRGGSEGKPERINHRNHCWIALLCWEAAHRLLPQQQVGTGCWGSEAVGSPMARFRDSPFGDLKCTSCVCLGVCLIAQSCPTLCSPMDLP